MAASAAGGAGAGAGAGAAAGAEPQEDTAVLDKIKGFLTSYEEQPETATGDLHLIIKSVNGKTYETTFRLTKHPGKQGYTEITNNCITIQFRGQAAISSEIVANSDPDTACFLPRLQSNASNAPKDTRTTATDVLQIVKLKLTMAYSPAPIRIEDVAHIGKVLMTPFRLLRGGTPFYQKYGYINHNIEEIQAELKDKPIQWVQEQIDSVNIDNILSYMNTNDDYYRELLTKQLARLKTQFAKVFKGTDPSALFSETLNTILSFEEENTSYSFFSGQLFFFLFYPFFDNIKTRALIFTFNPDSDEWRYWKSRVILSDATFSLNATTGGARGRRKTRKHTRKHKRNRPSRKQR